MTVAIIMLAMMIAFLCLPIAMLVWNRKKFTIPVLIMLICNIVIFYVVNIALLTSKISLSFMRDAYMHNLMQYAEKLNTSNNNDALIYTSALKQTPDKRGLFEDTDHAPEETSQE